MTTLANRTATPTDTFEFVNIDEADVDELSFRISTPVLTAGATYWLQIDTAVATNGDPVDWDQSNGPSTAYISGALLPDGFQCKGPCNGSELFELTASSAPEPGR